MATKIVALILVLTIASAASSLAQTQTTADKSTSIVKDWQGLRDVKVGQWLVVYTKQGREIEGKFADFEGGTLNLTIGFEVFSVEQTDIQEVRRKVSRNRGRIIGTIVGVVAGAMIGGAVGLKAESPGVESPAPAIMAASTLGAGGLGYAIGARYDRKRKGKLLYQAP